ncbi:MAG: glyceraldehyde 3-phosphate dehydrogenase NAD-binding domain-containing protein [Chloroflexota bacterium]
MSKIRVAINGLGRIGKNICRVIVQDFQEQFEIVGANDLLPVDDIAISMQRDSVHGPFPVEVNTRAETILQIGSHHVKVFAEPDAVNIDWASLKVDVVFECSRFYLTSAKAESHIKAGAKKVIMSAPPKDETPIFVVGVNDEAITQELSILSNASCTTNCLAPVTKALDKAFGILGGLISTTHAATSDQHLVDTIGGAKERSALNNIIPTSTGAARAIGKVLPHLDGKLNGTALRVPINDGSVVEAVFVIDQAVTVEDIHAALTEQAKVQNRRSMNHSVLYVGTRYQVSADCIGAPWSSMVLTNNTQVIPLGATTLVKLTSFYDNEMGYSYRMVDLAAAAMNA